MERADLQAFLERGLSLEQIAKRVGKDASTVGYWVQKHGLRAVNHDKYAPRGGIERTELKALVEEGGSISDIAAALGLSTSTVRHWLKRYELKTKGSAGRRRKIAHDEAVAAGLKVIRSVCRRHGEGPFVLEGRGYYRCRQCRQEAVVRRRRKVKAILVAEAGGRCVLCGYDRSLTALHFHHVDPTAKRFGIAHRGLARSIDKMRDETRKCVLLCSNCHAEVESGAVPLPP